MVLYFRAGQRSVTVDRDTDQPKFSSLYSYSCDPEGRNNKSAPPHIAKPKKHATLRNSSGSAQKIRNTAQLKISLAADD